MKIAPAWRIRPASASARGPEQLEVLGRQPVDQRRRCRQVAQADDGAEVAPAGGGDRLPRQRRELLLDRGRDPIGQALAVGDQDRLRALVVLRLAEQVGGDPGGILVAVGDHHDLRRTGDQVDADPAEDLALGLGDVGVAGADDLVDRADRRGAEGERCDRLGAADAVDLVDPGERGRDQHQRRQRAIRRRHAHRQALDARDPGRHGVHQDRARIGSGTARDVDPDRLDRPPAQAEPHAQLVGELLVRGQLAAMEGGDPRGGELERGAHVRRAGGDRPRDLVVADPKPLLDSRRWRSKRRV